MHLRISACLHNSIENGDVSEICCFAASTKSCYESSSTYLEACLMLTDHLMDLGQSRAWSWCWTSESLHFRSQGVAGIIS